ncbi:GTP-binding protein RHO1 precursor, putative [Entamoeba invadens IP1]|uniref:small monomeric GTPase n=1 Tax=Entamoeba invadens IP1 TaxID=370355 RepID=L7FMS2_ENTIV|nr:GTP-binding protein RHO1 precursor, putative [Entamoeba invadens IP1]ELP89616.1 GTP-binding protein RHO1 precursor, putative [Entamoeba invadens IP1]|eukprot:XP_004256387.1 GTP-binding protein RHO1 precursor, putative [Entamoeba invadens IP1]
MDKKVFKILNQLYGIPFSEDYDPTIEDSYKFVLNDKFKTEVTIYDTAGQPDYDALLDVYIQMAECTFISFALNYEEQQKLAQEKFVGRILKCKKNIPIVVVGTKSDMREDKDEIIRLKQMGRKMIETEDGIKFAQSIGAVGYFECSAKTNFFIRLVLLTISKIIKMEKGY